MTDVAYADCPACGLAKSLSFESGVENQSPLGSGEYWPMAYNDVNQQCECDLSEEQWLAAEEVAWASLSALATAGIPDDLSDLESLPF